MFYRNPISNNPLGGKTTQKFYILFLGAKANYHNSDPDQSGLTNFNMESNGSTLIAAGWTLVGTTKISSLCRLQSSPNQVEFIAWSESFLSKVLVGVVLIRSSPKYPTNCKVLEFCTVIDLILIG